MTHEYCRNIAILNDLWYSKFNELEFLEKKNLNENIDSYMGYNTFDG